MYYVLPILIVFILNACTLWIGPCFLLRSKQRKELSKMPWWEIARAIYPLRVFLVTHQRTSVIAATFAGYMATNQSNLPQRWMDVSLILLCGIVAWLISSCLSKRAWKKVMRQTGRKEFLMGRKNPLLFEILVIGIIASALLFLFFGPDDFSVKTGLLAVTAMLVLFFLGNWGMFAISRFFGVIYPLSDSWQEKLRPLSKQSGLKNAPSFLGIRMEIANALALHTQYAIAFTDGLFEALNKEEILAIAAHEFAHLTESRSVQIFRKLYLLPLFPMLFIRQAMAQWGIYAGAFITLVLLIALSRVFRMVTYRLEKKADSIASGQVENETEEQTVYATALSKIYEYNLIPAVMPGKNLTHPHLYDRMKASGITPDFARPLPPNPYTAIFLTVFFFLLSIIAVILCVFVPDFLY